MWIIRYKQVQSIFIGLILMNINHLWWAGCWKCQPIKQLAFILHPISSPDADTPVCAYSQPELIPLQSKLLILKDIYISTHMKSLSSRASRFWDWDRIASFLIKMWFKMQWKYAPGLLGLFVRLHNLVKNDYISI